jgi:hypothetical protein
MKRNIFKLDVAGSISVACAGLVKITKLHGCARQTPLAQQASVRKGPFAQKLICARYPRVHPAFILGNEKVTRGIGAQLVFVLQVEVADVVTTGQCFRRDVDL